MSRILVSAGHTNTDPGAIFGGLREADFTRKIAEKVVREIKETDVEVQGVPLDLPLLQRIQWINNTMYSEHKGDICIEIHINDGGKRGIESWFKGEGENESQKLAKVLAETISEETGYQNQGHKSEFQHELGSLTFLNRTSPITVILETLFIDNPEDVEVLKNDTKLNELAKAIAKATLRYLGKDEKGKDLPEGQKPQYNDLKKVPLTKPVMPGIPRFQGNGLPGGFGMGQPAPISSTPATGSGSFMMDREQRKEMIEKCYQRMLGRKPKLNELNYFLNQGIAETDLIKKIADSQEHLDILKSKLELKEAKEELSKITKQNKGMKAMIREQKALMDNLNTLIAHKNQALNQSSLSPVEILEAQEQASILTPQEEIVETQVSVTERFMGFIIRRFG